MKHCPKRLGLFQVIEQPLKVRYSEGGAKMTLDLHVDLKLHEVPIGGLIYMDHVSEMSRDSLCVALLFLFDVFRYITRVLITQFDGSSWPSRINLKRRYKFLNRWFVSMKEVCPPGNIGVFESFLYYFS